MAVLSSPIFANAKNVGGEGSVLQHLLNIYVMRNATVWKVNDVQAFLLQSAQYAVASSELAHVNSQVLELPSCLDKYMRAVANGKHISFHSRAIDVMITLDAARLLG